MAVWNRIKSLNIKQLFLLVKTFGLNPLYFFPTHRATLTTMQICDRLFKKAHHKNNVNNAYRHALWNILIAKNVYPKNHSVKKSLEWAKKITDLHEKLAPNSELEMKMDLHNNEVGRRVFAEKQLQNKDKENIISILNKKKETAIKVTSVVEMETNKDEFVYIEDLNF